MKVLVAPETAELMEYLRTKDVEYCVEAYAVTASVVDGCVRVFQEAGIPTPTRLDMPQHLTTSLAGMALMKTWLLEIGKAVDKIDEAHAFLKLAMADPQGGVTGAVSDGHDWVRTSTTELVKLCRAYTGDLESGRDHE